MGRGVWAWQTIGECVVSAVKYGVSVGMKPKLA